MVAVSTAVTGFFFLVAVPTAFTVFFQGSGANRFCSALVPEEVLLSRGRSHCLFFPRRLHLKKKNGFLLGKPPWQAVATWQAVQLLDLQLLQVKMLQEEMLYQKELEEKMHQKELAAVAEPVLDFGPLKVLRETAWSVRSTSRWDVTWSKMLWTTSPN